MKLKPSILNEYNKVITAVFSNIISTTLPTLQIPRLCTGSMSMGNSNKGNWKL